MPSKVSSPGLPFLLHFLTVATLRLSKVTLEIRENGLNTTQPMGLWPLFRSANGLSAASEETKTSSGNEESSRTQRLLSITSSLNRVNIFPGVPILGSVPELPAKHSWLQFHEWAKTYGPLCQVQLLGDTIVLISDPKIAEDLLVKRQANYSSRAHFPAIWGDCATDVHYLPLMAHGRKEHGIPIGEGY